MLTFAFMHYPYLVCILFSMPSLHLFTFFLVLYSWDLLTLLTLNHRGQLTFGNIYMTTVNVAKFMYIRSGKKISLKECVQEHILWGNITECNTSRDTVLKISGIWPAFIVVTTSIHFAIWNRHHPCCGHIQVTGYRSRARTYSKFKICVRKLHFYLKQPRSEVHFFQPKIEFNSHRIVGNFRKNKFSQIIKIQGRKKLSRF